MGDGSKATSGEGYRGGSIGVIQGGVGGAEGGMGGGHGIVTVKGSYVPKGGGEGSTYTHIRGRKLCPSCEKHVAVAKKVNRFIA